MSSSSSDKVSEILGGTPPWQLFLDRCQSMSPVPSYFRYNIEFNRPSKEVELGLIVGKAEGGVNLVVKEVIDNSLIQGLNASELKLGGKETLESGDIITYVNGTTGNPHLMYGRLCTDMKFDIEVRRFFNKSGAVVEVGE